MWDRRSEICTFHFRPLGKGTRLSVKNMIDDLILMQINGYCNNYGALRNNCSPIFELFFHGAQVLSLHIAVIKLLREPNVSLHWPFSSVHPYIWIFHFLKFFIRMNKIIVDFLKLNNCLGVYFNILHIFFKSSILSSSEVVFTNNAETFLSQC